MLMCHWIGLCLTFLSTYKQLDTLSMIHMLASTVMNSLDT